MNKYATVKSYILEYIKEADPQANAKNKDKLFFCPKRENHTRNKDKPTANIFPKNSDNVNCFECGKIGDIFDVVRVLEPEMGDLKKEEIAEYLIDLLDIEFNEEEDDLLQRYYNAGFYLFPLRGSGSEDDKKKPLTGFKWTKDACKDIKVWRDWLDRGYGLGLKLGKQSNVVAVDIDDDETQKKVESLLGNTLMQTTRRGKHYLYNYGKEFEDINHINFRSYEGSLDMELRANNAYIVIAPTSAGGEIRKWNNEKIQDMPEELKKFLFDKIKSKGKQKTPDEDIQEAIDKEDLGIKNGLRGLDGECNDFFIRFGGILRKKLNVDNTEYVLFHLNQALADPMDRKSLKGMFYQLRKYKTYDKEELAQEVLDRLDIIKEGTAFQIAGSLKREQKDIEEVLKYLEDQGEVIPIANRKYKRLERVEWVTGFEDYSVPINFTVPYFSKYARFDKGNMIIIGGHTGVGKTIIASNFIKGFEEQKNIESIDLITTESGSKIGNNLKDLKVSPEFVHRPKKMDKHPTELELRDDRITIIDWLKPKEGDFSKIDNTFEFIHNQLRKHSGLAIVFVQVREDGTLFAPDQINNYSALTAVYQYQQLENGGLDNLNTMFKTKKIRDSKVGSQFLTIPTKFNPETKRIELR